MRVALQTEIADENAAGPRRDHPKPHLRLIDATTRPSARQALPRLAVILSADTVNYTRHMAADEAGTHARCTAIRRGVIEPGIADHDARIVKHTGDGFLAEFQSATRAVWFAVMFQHALRAWNVRRRRGARIEFRVGINLGDVIVEAHDLFGHSVNVAARLQAMAGPGDVLVSHAVFASVRDTRLRFEDAGALSLKNVDEPVHGFRARLAAVRRPARMGRATGLEPVTSRTTTWRSAN